MLKKKCAFLVEALDSGGIENYLLRFLTHYKNEIDATVYCKAGYIGDLKEQYLAQNIKIKTFPIGFFSLKRFKNLKEELIREKYDSICDFTGNFAAIPLYMAKKAGMDKRIVFYRSSSNRFKETFGRLAYNKIVNYLIRYSATVILANSKTALNFFFKDYWKGKAKFSIIYNGIDSEIFRSDKINLRTALGFSDNDFVIGHVGRLNEAKNHKTAIEVAIKLCKEHKDVCFVFSGRNVDVAYMNEIENEGLSDQIKLLGYRSDVVRVLNSLDCFYFPSITEGQPNALIEALVCGLPFVASDIDPIKETVPPEYHHQLIPPTNVSLAISKLLEIKNNETLKNELNLSEWAIDYYNPERCFKSFFEKL